MKTFEEIKENIKKSEISLMQQTMQKLEQGGLMDYEKASANMIIRECQSVIENIDEAATIEIGAQTNSLIKSIGLAYTAHLNEYWQNFEEFINKYVLGLTPDGEKIPGTYLGQSQCLELGVGIKELSCFKGISPTSKEAGDLFRNVINANYGTNIPMSGIEEQALQNYNAVASGNDEIAKAQAYVHLMEVKRDSGALMNGGSYFLLATNQDYQNAKAMCTGRKL